MQFQTHSRIRLGLGLATNAQLPPCTCHIGEATAVDHSLVCNFTKGEAKTRHNLVTMPLRDGFRKSGAPSSCEPPYASLALSAAAAANAAGARADVIAVFKGRIVMTDTKIIHPAAASYRRAAARKSGAAAELAEKAKWRTFRENGGGDNGADFVPCVVESVGWVGKELKRLVASMGSCVAENGGCKRTFVRHMYEAMSCALARGNTRMFVHGLGARLRKAGGAFQAPYDVCISGHCVE